MGGFIDDKVEGELLALGGVGVPHKPFRFDTLRALLKGEG
jgi:hypothetical protein